jgi:hypothetical protein
MAKKYNPVKVVTGVVRLLNANIWGPLEVPGRGGIYTATILIPKDDSKTVTGINTAVQGAFAAGRLERKGHVGRNPTQNYPVHDGDDRSLPPVFNGCYYINAASLTAPQILDHQLYPVTDSGTVGSGCLVRVSLSFFYVFRPRASRVGCMLGNIQKARISDSYEAIPDASFEKCLDDYLLIFDKDPG